MENDEVTQLREYLVKQQQAQKRLSRLSFEIGAEYAKRKAVYGGYTLYLDEMYFNLYRTEWDNDPDNAILRNTQDGWTFAGVPCKPVDLTGSIAERYGYTLLRDLSVERGEVRDPEKTTTARLPYMQECPHCGDVILMASPNSAEPECKFCKTALPAPILRKR